MAESSTASLLPKPRLPLTITKAVNLGNIKARQYSDWFMGLASAMHHAAKDPTQCRMFAKMSFFMMDVFPRGLVSDFGHINGDDVMHQLLCHMNEMAASRHKVSRDAETAWQQLEKWMSLGDDWKAAFEKARQGPSAGKNRHKPMGKVPGLLSPAGIMAVMILAYPDIKKYQTRIEQLGIQWMIQPRDTLQVRRGFWKQITNSDLRSIFDAEDERKSEVPFLADYTQLFGKNFPSYRVDMRPYLPPWATGVVQLQAIPEVPVGDLDDDHTPYLPHDPDGVSPGDKTVGLSKSYSSLDTGAGTCFNRHTHGDADTDGDADADSDTAAELLVDEEASMNHALDLSGTSDQIRGLSVVLNPVHSKTETELMRWLMTKPCAEEVLLPWCKFWVEMHDQAQSYDEQIVTRSLFLQSLRKLQSLRSSVFSDAAESYMLQDMEDVRATPSTPGHVALEELDQGEAYVAWQAVRTELMRYVDAGYADDLATLLDRQACFFREVEAHEIFSSYIEGVVTLDRLRAQGCLGIEDPKNEGEKTYRRWLLDNRATLRLTKWQLRAIVMPGHSDVLTPEQARIYGERVTCSPEDSLYNTVRHRPTIPLDILVDRDQIDRTLGYDLLRKLFGKIPPPGSVQASTSTSSATQRAPPAKGDQPQARQFMSTHMRRPRDVVNGSGKETPLFATYANHQPKYDMVRADAAPDGSSRQSSATPSAGLATDKSLFAIYESINQGKRTASPSARPPKKVKLTELTREDFVKDIETYNSCLTEDLVREIRSSRAELASEVTEKIAQAEAALSAKMTAQVKEFIEKLGSQSEVQAKQISDEMTAVSNRMENNLGKLQAKLANMEAYLAKPSPQIGEDGFLTQNCPAPTGWNQKDYEALLTRAAINLIANEESPSGELLITIDKYALVKDSFPDIPVYDFSVAFEHEYVRAFNRPFDRNKLLGLSN